MGIFLFMKVYNMLVFSTFKVRKHYVNRLLKPKTMKKILLTSLFFLSLFYVNAQCTIEPFIQQNYSFDAKLLVLREIESNTNDPDYDNPIISQTRADYYLEKFSAMYRNPQNDANIDSLFNEFQFHANTYSIHYKTLFFSVDTNTSWVQSLKDNGTTGMSAFDNLLSQYQFFVDSYNDYISAPFTGKTIFRLVTANDILNTYALRDDFQTASPGADLSYDLVHFNDNICSYSGIPYTIETYELPPQQASVTSTDIFKNSNNGRWYFVLMAGCIPFSNPDYQYRFVTVSDDCNTVDFSRTLSNEAFELEEIVLYPNPATSTLNIQGIDNVRTIEIHSMVGKKIMDTTIINTQLDISTLQNGVYFLRITDNQNRSLIKKFIKQ